MIRLCHPAFDADDRARVDAVLETGQLVQSRFVAELEAVLGARLGRDAIACSNGTAALHLAMLALGVGAGDDVIIPAFTWPSAASVVMLVGARPVFADIDPETLCAPASEVERVWTDRVRAVVAIHQFGIPAEVERMRALCDNADAWLVEDAACAIGTQLEGGREAGTVGDVSCFSFHPRKVLTTGEGGLVACADKTLADRVRTLRNHGQGSAGLMRFVEPGPNYRMPELSAALGVGAASRLDATLAQRRSLARRYVEALSSVEGVAVPRGVADPRGNHQSFVVRVAAPARDAVLSGLRARGVECTIGTYSVPQQQAFGGAPPEATPVAWAAMHELVTLPLHEGMVPADVDEVVTALTAALEEVR